ncbi:hypothetical protein HS125_09680 [bacterium]|nr:hypothetical protein [bacterium]
MIERNRKPAPGDVVVLAESIGKRWLARYVETDKHVALVTSDLDFAYPDPGAAGPATLGRGLRRTQDGG